MGRTLARGRHRHAEGGTFYTELGPLAIGEHAGEYTVVGQVDERSGGLWQVGEQNVRYDGIAEWHVDVDEKT